MIKRSSDFTIFCNPGYASFIPGRKVKVRHACSVGTKNLVLHEQGYRVEGGWMIHFSSGERRRKEWIERLLVAVRKNLKSSMDGTPSSTLEEGRRGRKKREMPLLRGEKTVKIILPCPIRRGTWIGENRESSINIF